MSFASVTSGIGLSGRGHAWKDKDGTAYAVVPLGEVMLSFDSADDARAVAARCAAAAEAIDALNTGEAGNG